MLRILAFSVVLGGCIEWESLSSIDGLECRAFVAEDGADEAAGTLTAPFRTLARGVRDLQPGDTLCIREGTYREALIDTIPAGTSWDDPVTVAAVPGEHVVLRPESGETFVLRFVGPQRYIVVQGLVLDATNVAGNAVKITWYGTESTEVSLASHIRLVDCELRNSPSDAIHLDGHDDELIRLGIFGNGRIAGHGINMKGAHHLVDGCEIADNFGYGVHVFEESQRGVDENLIRNNRIHDNGVSGAGPGILLTSGRDNAAINNLVWGNRIGIMVTYSSIGARVYNNTVFDNAGTGILVGSESSDADVQNNIVYASDVPVEDLGAGTTLAANVSEDPLFVDSGAGDFHLQAGSPAIDTGVMLPGVDRDIEGHRRPQGAGPDVGAYEH